MITFILDDLNYSLMTNIVFYRHKSHDVTSWSHLFHAQRLLSRLTELMWSYWFIYTWIDIANSTACEA
jgi:hypothetical protein